MDGSNKGALFPIYQLRSCLWNPNAQIMPPRHTHWVQSMHTLYMNIWIMFIDIQLLSTWPPPPLPLVTASVHLLLNTVLNHYIWMVSSVFHASAPHPLNDVVPHNRLSAPNSEFTVDVDSSWSNHHRMLNCNSPLVSANLSIHVIWRTVQGFWVISEWELSFLWLIYTVKAYFIHASGRNTKCSLSRSGYYPCFLRTRQGKIGQGSKRRK